VSGGFHMERNFPRAAKDEERHLVLEGFPNTSTHIRFFRFQLDMSKELNLFDVDPIGFSQAFPER